MTANVAPPARRPTPRPVLDGPAVVRRDETAHHVWGDTQAGFVTDRVYISSSLLHVLEYELAPGSEFRHSALNPTVFGADVVYAVLSGTLVIADPEHGEVHRVEAGSAVLFRRDTWHHGFNPSGADTVRVLEFFAPPPSRGTASDYARRQSMLTDVRYRDDRWAGKWPAARSERDAAARLHVVREVDRLWAFAGTAPSHLVGTIADTEHLLVRAGFVEAGHVEDFQPLPDESLLVVTDGELWVDVRDSSGAFIVSCLQPGDAAYLPSGSEVRVLVRAGKPARYLQGFGRPVPEGWSS